jgi:DNA transformation protein and related proteins
MHRAKIEYTKVRPRPPGADFADYCCELLSSVGDVQARRMFGGWGLSVDGLTFGLIGYETLYLKCNEKTKPTFIAAGCQIFEYEMKSGTGTLQYFSAPDQAMTSTQAMEPWASLAWQAALEVDARKKAIRRKKLNERS